MEHGGRTLKVGLWLCFQGFYTLWIKKRNVTLTRAMENEKQVERATATVKSVYGVRKVNDLLMIKK
jgi:osmotically-inducible protein OsmY